MDEADDGLHIRAPTVEDVVRICRSLNEHSARYLLIGGFAVIAHGGGRTTKDIDFLVDSSPENVARIKTGLSSSLFVSLAEPRAERVETP